MVVKRQCSFCAREIEPGTGSMYVKRDGTVFTFCSSSCRRQQLDLGRVGHRFKWTRAYALKRTAERSTVAARARVTAAPSAPTSVAVTAPPSAPAAGEEGAEADVPEPAEEVPSTAAAEAAPSPAPGRRGRSTTARRPPRSRTKTEKS